VHTCRYTEISSHGKEVAKAGYAVRELPVPPGAQSIMLESDFQSEVSAVWMLAVWRPAPSGLRAFATA
jgi:hypothetical protein